MPLSYQCRTQVRANKAGGTGNHALHVGSILMVVEVALSIYRTMLWIN